MEVCRHCGCEKKYAPGPGRGLDLECAKCHKAWEPTTLNGYLTALTSRVEAAEKELLASGGASAGVSDFFLKRLEAVENATANLSLATMQIANRMGTTGEDRDEQVVELAGSAYDMIRGEWPKESTPTAASRLVADGGFDPSKVGTIPPETFEGKADGRMEFDDGANDLRPPAEPFSVGDRVEIKINPFRSDIPRYNGIGIVDMIRDHDDRRLYHVVDGDFAAWCSTDELAPAPMPFEVGEIKSTVGNGEQVDFYMAGKFLVQISGSKGNVKACADFLKQLGGK